MRVDLAQSALNAGDDWALTLFLFGLVGRHRVLPDALASASFATWLSARSEDVRSIVEFATDWATRAEAASPSAQRVQVALPAGVGQLSPARAVEFLQRPYRLLLEDGIRDRDFLLRMCTAREASLLRDWIQREWLEIEHGGGNTRMILRLRELEQPPRSGALLSVMFDSEATAPQRPSPESEDLRNFCAQRNIPHHQLQRRAIENYLPRSAFERWVTLPRTREQRAERRAKLEAKIAKLTAVERHYLRLKDVAKTFGALYGEESAMNAADIANEGGPAELHPFVRSLIASVR